jgi:peptidoglycan biosynthesis protein MviN/MurJ (putative lipid II flippase)
LLLYALRRKLARLDLTPLLQTLPATLGSAIVAGAAAWVAGHYWQRSLGHEGLPARLGAVFVPMTLAGLIYGGITFSLRVPAAQEFAALVLHKFRRGSK